jgi:hypothetical protein
VSLYLIEELGDLNGPLQAYPTLNGALAALAARFGQKVTNADGEEYYDTPDPEDDRIIVWEATPGEVCKAVWHFSGWHWDHEASDLPGGPLEQGVLPGCERSLYELAVDDML